MMKEKLAKYVDDLFAGHQLTRENHDLKEEILSNLEAKVADYLEQGMTPQEAYEQAIKHIGSIDLITEEHTRIHVAGFFTELFQTALIYALLAWILTIPSRVMLNGSFLNNSLLVVSGVLGIVYLLLIRLLKETANSKVSRVNIKSVRSWTRRVWWIWLGFIVAAMGSVLALRFGSNLWFWRPVHISGPYQFAEFVHSLAAPMLSVALPLLFQQACKLVKKHEVTN